MRAPDSTVGDHYQRSGFSYDEVFLLGRTPDSRSIVAREIGHAIMDDIYEDAYPATPNCSGHKVDTASSAGCAWTEGFADWLPLAVYGTSGFKWQANSTYDLEPPTWNNAGFQDGDTVEGRVAGALLDLHDRRAESWDACAETALRYLGCDPPAPADHLRGLLGQARGRRARHLRRRRARCLCQNTIAALHTYVCALGALRGLVQLVAGKMRRFEPREGDEVVVAERLQRTYARQVFLGDALDSERVQANCQLVVLTLTIPLPRRPSRGACRSAGARTPRRSSR